jgi:hypothetical protein
VTRDAAVFTTEIKQRLAFVHFRVVHFPDKNRVVTRNVRRDQVAAHLKKRALDNGGAAACLPKMDAQALFRFAAMFAFCEVFGNGFLPCFEDTDTETFFLFKKMQHFRAMVNADENQHGIERDGREGVGGHAMNLPGLALNGNHGDAGGEMAEGFAEFGLRKWRSWHLASF